MIRLASAVLLAALASAAGADTCREGVLQLRGDWGRARFNVEIADDAAERARGLMFRDRMPMSAGMLFVYEAPQHASFWMKNTLIPLDMIFADETGTVTRVHDRAIPHDETGIDGGEGVQFVLEINGGLAKSMGIVPGTQLRNPAIGEDAAWACE